MMFLEYGVFTFMFHGGTWVEWSGLPSCSECLDSDYL